MVRSALCTLLAFVFCAAALAQQKPAPKWSLGLEQDVLPYITGGYFAGAWAGKGHVRARALTARVHKPRFTLPEGFANNRVTAYALVADYFFKPGWQGLWVSTGPTYWRSSIQSDARQSTVRYENLLLNGSLGYNIPLPHHLYLSPWAGMHLLILGNRHFSVDGSDYTVPLLNPEASIKVGWQFR